MKNISKFKLIYIFAFSAIGVMIPLVGQYLNSVGMTGTQIGTITAIGTVVSIFATTFWGKVYAKVDSKHILLGILAISAALSAVLGGQITTFILFTLIYSLIYFFQGAIMGLLDAMALEQDFVFSKVRLFGAVGYAVSVFIGGRLSESLGLEIIFPIYSISFVLAGILLFRVGTPKSKHPKLPDNIEEDRSESSKKNKSDISYGKLMKETDIVKLILVGIFIFGSNVANNTYFGFLYRDGGGSVAGVGIAFLLMVGSEVPFMAIAPMISKKLGLPNTILAAMIVSVLRFAMYATGPNHYILLGTFFLQGAVNGILLTEYLRYISIIVKKELMPLAVSAFYVISCNVGTIICNFFGGIVMDQIGSQGVYGLFAILNILGAAMYVFFGINKRNNGLNQQV